MSKVAVIGGTGLTSIEELTILKQEQIETPYGACSAAFTIGELAGKEIIFLARHGSNHTIPPHKINYRANVWGLQQLGVTHVIGVAAVGGIHAQIEPEKIIIPAQIIDYTYGREHTFFAENLDQVTHIDFTHPYCDELRNILLNASKKLDIKVFEGGTYAATQGPRLETAAEIRRLQNDGCDIVGMTAMPEAALAKELGLCYATCALCANWAAGKGDKEITMQEIQQTLDNGMDQIRQLLITTVKSML